MSALQKTFGGIWAFIIDYIGRHKHPVNAVLHIFGVPMAFYGLYRLFTGAPAEGIILLVLGYLFQYLGHKAQGNEVGEVTLIKKIWRKVQGPGKLSTND
jgi:hypothetical protein